MTLRDFRGNQVDVTAARNGACGFFRSLGQQVPALISSLSTRVRPRRFRLSEYALPFRVA